MSFFSRNTHVSHFPSTSTRTSSPSVGPPEELLTSIVGPWGRWRALVTFILCIIMGFHGLNLFAAELLVPPHLAFNCTEEEKSHQAHSCQTSNGTACRKFAFSQRFGQTATEKWKLVCENQTKTVVVNVLFRCGLVVGFIFSGHFADSWGRKKLLFLNLALQPAIGILVKTSISFWLFTAARFFYGFSLSGTTLMAIIIMCEISSNKWRTFQIGVLGLSVAVGHALLPYASMVFSDSMKTALFLSIPQIALFVFVGVIRESADWLLCSSQTTRAESVLLSVANFNGERMPSTFRIRPLLTLNANANGRGKLLILLQSPTTRWSIAFLYFIWFLASSATELSLVHLLAKEEFLLNILALSGVASIAAAILSIALCHVMQHRIVIAFSSTFGCLTTISTYLINRQFHKYKYMVFHMQLSTYGLYSIATFALWNMTARVFPTETRGQGTGLAFAVGELSFVAARLLHYNTHDQPIIFLIAICTCTAITILCCIPLFSVHNRELPDIVEDCLRFKRLYKPARWSTLRATSPTIDESEVKIVDFERGTSLTVEHTRPFYFYGFGWKKATNPDT